VHTSLKIALKLTCTPSVRPSPCSFLTFALAPPSLSIPTPLCAAGVPATFAAGGPSNSMPSSSNPNNGSSSTMSSSAPPTSTASLSPPRLKPPRWSGDEVGRTRPPSAPAGDDECMCCDPKGVRDWESLERKTSNLSARSRSARSSSGGNANSGRKEGSSWRMSWSGLWGFSEHNTREEG
jgi:hypothetical protein